ncbi:MAG: hypothetical protein UX45_C0036G0001 [Candidatus Uhrbacteria bacterium GW2011_GWF2_46_218]|uniref:Uncharacterized protein n=1 Tax=Candidatus Uhrbacteria bacterium GW2011_GWF2_46_218 TaxID=1619001 RepID=A0A0G1RL93_9BACT|nr:MAG: hypothetical protein UX45_C0036G0001 [Candidatus Uhrbacteria bacterium GW2011_GWF2_46_218]
MEENTMPVDKGQDKMMISKVLSSPLAFPLISAIFAKNTFVCLFQGSLIHMKKS